MVSFCVFVVLVVDVGLCIACFLSFHRLFVFFGFILFPTLKRYFILVVIQLYFVVELCFLHVLHSSIRQIDNLG